jgi:superfamily II DNA or RNA helicase
VATIYRVVTVDDEDGSELGAAEYFDVAGQRVAPPPSGPGPARSALTGDIPRRFVPDPRSGGTSTECVDDRGTEARSLSDEHWTTLFGCRAVFLPGDPARGGRMAFHTGGASAFPSCLPAEAAGELEVVVAHGRGARRRTVPAVVRPLSEVLPRLLRERGGVVADNAGRRRLGESASVWRHAALYALHMAGRGLLLPGLSGQSHDMWRLGPFTPQDAAWVRALAEVLPVAAYGVPTEPRTAQGKRTARGPVLLPDPYTRLRDFLDAVADLLPRTPAAVAAAGMRAFAATEPQRAPELRGWAARVADGRDTGVRVSLRVELTESAGLGGDDWDGQDDWDGEPLESTSPTGPTAPASGVSSSTSEAPVVRAVVQLHSLADPLLIADAAEVWHGGVEGFGRLARDRALRQLRRAAPLWPPLVRLLEQPAPDELGLNDGEFLDLLDGGALLALRQAEVAVHLPRDLVRDLTAHAVVEPEGATDREADEEIPSLFSGEQLLDFRWKFAVGDRTLTQAELDRLAHARRPLVRLRDQWVVVDAALVAKARRATRRLGTLEALTAALTGSAEDPDGVLVPVRANGWLRSLRDRLATPEQAHGDELAVPEALSATLRDYQRRGLAWLDRMTRLGLGACLADDMGLGKTITAIALHLRRQEDPATATGPTLVVCPASLLGNWSREIARFAPDTPWRRHHGPGRDLDGVEPGEIVLTTYGTMRRDAEELTAAGPWGLIVADEAQHAKNPAGATAKALRTLPGAARVALSGTPVENNLTELWALLDWATPGLLGPLKAFRERYGRAAERAARTAAADGAAGPGPQGHDAAATERLSRLIGPFVLRRRKSDPGIAPELPPKTETDQRVLLTREQTVLYEAQVRESLAAIREASGIARRGLVLKLLTALKQICNHPAQYLKEPEGTARLTGRSGKLELLDELLDVIRAEDESVLLFTQYTQMAGLLRGHLSARGVPVLYLHGRTPVRRREEMVDAFQRGEAPVFLLSLKAAGTGLNLTRAGHVVHYDRWWNPAVEDQATDRAYRIGQTRPVQVHRMISEGTVEDRIDRLLASKRGLADAVLGGGGEAAFTDLTDAELADLVSLHTANAGRSSR